MTVTTGARACLGLVVDVEQTFLDIGFRDPPHRVAEFLGDQFGSIGVDQIAGLHHLALLHHELDDIDRAFGHALRQFLDGDGLGQPHLA
jgi:hypothetical protein